MQEKTRAIRAVAKLSEPSSEMLRKESESSSTPRPLNARPVHSALHPLNTKCCSRSLNNLLSRLFLIGVLIETVIASR